jgi:hypothetical protein
MDIFWLLHSLKKRVAKGIWVTCDVQTVTVNGVQQQSIRLIGENGALNVDDLFVFDRKLT